MVYGLEISRSGITAASLRGSVMLLLLLCGWLGNVLDGEQSPVEPSTVLLRLLGLFGCPLGLFG